MDLVLLLHASNFNLLADVVVAFSRELSGKKNLLNDSFSVSNGGLIKATEIHSFEMV